MCRNMHRCVYFEECAQMTAVGCVEGWNDVDTRAVVYSEQQIGFTF
jgi:hypothetical protein